MPVGQHRTAGAEEDLAVVATSAAEAALLAAGVESASADLPPVVVRPTTIVEACIIRTPAPDRYLLRFVKLPQWPDRMLAGIIQQRHGQPKHPGDRHSTE